MKITLAIPNYNGAENLKNLLEQALKENFNHIYVLDDSSTDNSKEIAKKFPDVIYVQGDENKGPPKNRNRILEQKYDEIIMFLDVDMQLLTSGLKEKIIENFVDGKVALVGGLIMTQKNEPMWWNYGFEMHPDRDAKAGIVHAWALDNWDNKEKIEKLREKYKDITRNLDISFGKPSIKKVDWVSEANFCVKADVFNEIGGFDGKMRYHADQDLCKRIRNKGYKINHSPAVQAMHLEIDTFGETRGKISRENTFYFYQKHWDMPRNVFDLLFPIPEESNA